MSAEEPVFSNVQDDDRLPAPEIPYDLDRYPQPHEFLQNGGMAGMDYLYAHANSVAEFQQDGWELVAGLRVFSINNVPMIVMCKGTPLEGTTMSHSTMPKFLVDPALDKATNLAPTKPKTVKSNGG